MHLSFLWPSSLRTRLLILVGVALVPILGISVLALNDQRAHQREQATERTLAVATTLAAEQARTFARSEDLLKLLASHVSVIAPQGLDSLDLTTCTALVRVVQRYNSSFGVIGVTDANGLTRCASAPAAVGLNLSDRSWFRGAFRTGEFTVSEVVTSRVTGKTTIAIAYPVKDPTGTTIGVIGTGLDLASLGALVGTATLPEGGALTVTDRDRIILARNPDSERFVGKAWTDAPPASSGATTVTSKGPDGVQHLYASAPLEAGTAGVVGSMTLDVPADVVFGAIERTYTAYLLALAAITVVTLGCALAGGNQLLVRPLRELQQVAQRVARGDLKAQAGPPYARGELGHLASLVDIMSQSLSAQLKQITILNRDLEEKVRERTNELARATQQLSGANEELETFAYSVSHDLRAPLRAIDGFSHTLASEYHDRLDERGQDRLRRIREAAQRLDTLIDDILQLSRTSRAPLRLQPVDLSATAHAIVEELRAGSPERAAEVVIAEGLSAEADPALLRGVLQNLLGNAWKFTSQHERARIEFGLTQRDGERILFVSDDGAGFDMQYASKLFGAFQRLHTPAEFPGNGIGLATVQRIVHRHGGRIWAEAVPNEGATFYFTLAGGVAFTGQIKEAA